MGRVFSMATDTNQDPLNFSSYLPSVSVIVPIYNGEQDLSGLLDRLMSQTYPAQQVEYLLVDNASSDRTPQILAEAADQFAAKGLAYKALSERDIQSAYAARNTGIRAASGEFLAFTDADCYPRPDWLCNLIQPFQDEQVGLVAGEVTAFPGTTLLERYAESKGTMSQQDTLAHPFCPYGQTANLGIRLTALKQVGLFRPYMTTGGDADICWRIQQEGTFKGNPWEIYYAENASVQHRHRQTLEDLRKQWYRYGKSNRYLNELHGVKLAWPLPQKERNRTILRWAIKELPLATFKRLFGRGSVVDMLISPLDIYCAQARDVGQKEAKLPENARRKIDYPVREQASSVVQQADG